MSIPTPIPTLLNFKGEHSQALCTLLSLAMDRKDSSSDYACRATFEQALPVYAASVLKTCVGWTGAWSVKKPALEFATIEVAAADSHRLLKETQMEVRSIDAEPKADGTGLKFIFKVDFLAEENDAIALLQHLKRELIVTVDNQQAALNFAKEKEAEAAAKEVEVEVVKREGILPERTMEIIEQVKAKAALDAVIYAMKKVTEVTEVTELTETEQPEAAEEDHAENGTAPPEQPAPVEVEAKPPAAAKPVSSQKEEGVVAQTVEHGGGAEESSKLQSSDASAVAGSIPADSSSSYPIHTKRQRGRPRLTEDEKATRKKERDDKEAADRAALLEKKRALDAEHGTSTAPPVKRDPDAKPAEVPASPAPRAPWRLGEYAHVKISDGKGGMVRYSGKVYRHLKETDELELQDFEKDPILVPAKIVTRSVNLLGDDRDVDEMIKDYLDIAKLKEKMISWDFIFDALSRAHNEHRLRIAADGFSYVLEEDDVQTAVAIAPKKPGAKPNVLETAGQSQNP